MSFVTSGSRTFLGAFTNRVMFVLLATMGVLLFSLPLFSQGSNGRLLGAVTDQTGGVVSGATVTIVDKDRGVARTLTTDAAGEYDAPQLLPGTYTVRAEAQGFKKIERENIELGVGKEVRVDLTVEPGAQEQTVTVTEALPLIETTNATLGGTLKSAEVVDLPLNGRNFLSLMGLRPGVMLQPGGSGWTYSTNNIRPDETSWMVEGILDVDGYDARPVAGATSAITDGATLLPVDAIQEFNMEENPKAEYGGKPGAMVNVGIRSGTNTLHGSAYAFGRSQALDARNVFNPAPDASGNCGQPVCDKGAVQLEQFGGALGGPIKKDKLFFFANYEGQRNFLANAISEGVPYTASAGAKADPGGSMVDAIIGVQNFIAANPGAIVQTGAGNVPLSVSPLSLKLLGCPSGTLTTASTCTGGVIQNALSNTTSYISAIPNTNRTDNGIAKIDYRISDKHMINGTFYKASYLGHGEDFAQVNSAWTDDFPESAWLGTGNWIWTVNSRVVNEFRMGYNRLSQALLPSDRSQFANGSYALGGVTYPINTGVTSYGGFPSITISGFGQTYLLGSRAGRPTETFPNAFYDFQDNLSYLTGKHSFKYGFEYSHINADAWNHDTRGIINFNGGVAFNGSTSLEDFFAGTPFDGPLLVGNPQIETISKVYGAFAQDDWRITPKVMLNLGLRWEYRSPFHEVNNKLGNFIPGVGLVQQGVGSTGSTLVKPDYKNFSPRIGFAYDVTGKGTTVVRGGFGIFYSMFTLAPFVGNPGITNVTNTGIATIATGGCTKSVPVGQTCSGAGGTTLASGGTLTAGSVDLPPSALNWNNVVFPAGGVVSCTAARPCSIGSVDPNLKTPFVYDWSLGVQRAITSNLSLDVSYVGTRGGNLVGNVDLNQAPPGSAFCLNPLSTVELNAIAANGLTNPCSKGPLAASKPSLLAAQEAAPYFSQFPWLQFINHVENYAYSHYNSLQATLTERPTHGLNFTVGYTYGHGLDNGSLNRFGAQPEDSTNTAREYASSDFDIRHRASFTASYEIPGKKGYGQMLEGWKLNTIVTIAGPQPWDVLDRKDQFSGTMEQTDRWDFVGNPSDFKDTAGNIPFCTGFPADFLTSGGADLKGVSCSSTSGISGIVTTLPSSMASACKAAPDMRTLGFRGCYVEGGSAMFPATLGTFGTMGRNIFRDNGFKNVDFSVFKNFKFTERVGAQFRVEFFNLFNTPVFTNPWGSVNGSKAGSNPRSPSPSGSTFGCGCSTPDIAAGAPITGSGDSRLMQLGLKIIF